MRILFFLYLLSSSTGLFAQTREIINYDITEVELKDPQIMQLNELVDNKLIDKIHITATVIRKATISNQRIISERRIMALKRYFVSKGIEENNLNNQIIIAEDIGDLSESQILLNINYREKQNDKVLKKTPVVQISLIDYVPPKKEIQKPIVKKEEKPEIPKVDSPKKGNQPTLKAEDFKKNQTIVLTNLLFEPGLHLMIPQSRGVLFELLEIMKKNPKLVIQLQGHICCRQFGLDGFDPVSGRENLSEMRAKTVYNFLVNQGIDAERLSWKGYGSSRKLSDDTFDPVAAQLNRRVEVLVIESE